ncbi:MAG: 30S ribosomal protein S2, partial [Leptotrichiaceae bacterium]|nr:30S ribosomal protein S2 [Leptotrichiaceae bacterium]
ALFVVDIKKEFLALEEAKKLGIPVIALIDTNVDPDLVTYKIPANDDAIRSVKLFAQVIANAAIEGNGGVEGLLSDDEVKETEIKEVETDTEEIIEEKSE